VLFLGRSKANEQGTKKELVSWGKKKSEEQVRSDGKPAISSHGSEVVSE